MPEGLSEFLRFSRWIFVCDSHLVEELMLVIIFDRYGTNELLIEGGLDSCKGYGWKLQVKGG